MCDVGYTNSCGDEPRSIHDKQQNDERPADPATEPGAYKLPWQVPQGATKRTPTELARAEEHTSVVSDPGQPVSKSSLYLNRTINLANQNQFVSRSLRISDVDPTRLYRNRTFDQPARIPFNGFEHANDIYFWCRRQEALFYPKTNYMSQ